MAKVMHIPSTHPDGERLAFWCEGCNGVMQVCPKRWNWNGDVDRPTLSPSILQTLGPFPDGRKEICHCFVRDGQIEFCGDCTHSLRGTRTLPELEEMLEIHREPDGRIWWVRKVREGGQ